MLDQLVALHNAASKGDGKAKAEFEVAGTEVMARLLHHLYFGKVDPKSLDPRWTFGRAFASGDPARLVNQYLNVASLEALVDDTALQHPAYLRLQEGLARYLAIKAEGGWPPVPDSTLLRPGEENEAVPALRRRLAVTGDYQGALGANSLYDDALVDVVKSFQTRHGLAADGVVGPRTFRALNRPVEDRIDQLRASLERARWLFRDIEENFVLVNIGGPETYLVQDGRLVWKARSIVGRSYRQTPVFRDDIRYMEFNPTWTVPVSIFRNDKLPLIRRDRNYLSRGNYTVLDSNGRPISPAAVNWNGTPRVTLRQEPGPWNAMGLVKFMFPNVHSVYLHDTDNRSLFDRNERNLSSGCVRIENPFQFADYLMKDDPDWSAERREAILASGRTIRVDLPSPMPVLLTYFTAWLDEAGKVQFREDLYERDDKVISALNAAFRS
ncbi:L,D-transpeptidase family protein [Ruegeria pomeroyi]|nr:L,D-transpeptidase family protein [Ruegeria pomeroyi]MCE8534649.1 L,D-transpeptidase family protein [Ruegeria pomeroyi]